MSLTSIMNIGVSGLMTAQEQLRITSDNISNVNTPGYIRKVSHQTAVNIGGKGMGVTSGQVTLAADRYLQAAQLKATSTAAAADVTYELLDQIQSQFGDITDTSNVFNQAASALSTMAEAAEDPTSNASRQQTLSNLSSFLSEGSRISARIQTIRGDADARISSSVKSVNDLLKNISDLNATISAATVAGDDATGAQTTQAKYIDDLSKLMDVNVTQNENGGVTVRTGTGMYLSGDKYATLSYQPSGNVDATTSFGAIVVTGINGEKRDLADNIQSGEIKGLMEIRDTTSVAVNDQLNQYMTQFAEQLNAAHNQGTSVPAPATMAGKTLSLTQEEAVTGFTGQTNLVTLDASGNITHRMLVDFSAGTWSLDNGATSGTFTPGNFASDLTTAFDGAATVGFANGRMTLSASGTNGNTGIAVVDPAASATVTPAGKQGQGFSHYFGLNDVVTSEKPTNYRTGLTSTSDSGFASGTVTFQLKSPNGASLASVAFTPTAGQSMADMVNGLNNTTSGMGRYGTFSLDGNGQLSFKGFGNPSNSLSIKSDTTSRLGTGASFGEFFGVGGTPATVSSGLAIRNAIYNDPKQMAMAKVNLNATGGLGALVSGDGSNGLDMSDIGSKTTTFAKTGLNSGGASTLERYGSDLAGQIGNLAANAKSHKESNEALLAEAQSRRSAYEGVNLDEELVNLTVYQQGYSAAGRLIQAAKDMYDTLLEMV
ncbi:flagellar hook-associated protein FlgK [Asticcacaulis biprosthecium C19]|uniref:Flagellar hook-associated protein 1 n=1 Tax=Asticcacaulis biprosthecium C19 TaxID=715226 RepID=F4QMK6_9CAUL|nr:flagellar hook-associated protein FlgK [Asticcacaulis biprosthecium]EGF91447.1 flagellar hook-associated protein FlgK [Asticcacaulis biprosthecium C19]